MKILDIFTKNKIKPSKIEGVEIQRSKKRLKTVSLKIKDGKAIISCPIFVDDNYLKELILKKKNWIKNKLKEKIKVVSFSENQKFPILGENYTIKFLISKKNKVQITKNLIMILCQKKINMKLLFISWLRNKSENYLTQRVTKLSKKLNIAFSSVFVRAYKARWGCCTSNSEIFLNWKLILLPKKIIDYVIIHELIHIIVPNHSKNFWRALEKVDHNYDKKKDWLKKNGGKFILFS